MSQKEDFKFESMESYYGNAQEVKRQMDNCSVCQTELVMSHQSDYTTLTIQETARCHGCGARERRVIHILN